MELKNRAGQGAAYWNLGKAYTLMGQYEKAISYLKKYLVIMLEVEDRAGQAEAYVNLSNAFGSMGQQEKAIAYAKKYLELGDPLSYQYEY